jgi:hypothetical protein
LYLSVNGTEVKDKVRTTTGTKTIDLIAFKENTRNNFAAISKYKSPFPEIKVSFKENESISGHCYNSFNGKFELIEKTVNQIIIEGVTFKYQFAPEMILHISNQFAKIKPVTAVKNVNAVKALPEVKQAIVVPEIKPKQAALNVSIVDYSERAVAIVGDTIKIKDILKELGCRYNKFLSCGAGWIASKRNIEAIKKELSKLTINVQIN